MPSSGREASRLTDPLFLCWFDGRIGRNVARITDGYFSKTQKNRNSGTGFLFAVNI